MGNMIPSWQSFSTACANGEIEVGIALYEPSGDCDHELIHPTRFTDPELAKARIEQLNEMCETLNEAQVMSKEQALLVLKHAPYYCGDRNGVPSWDKAFVDFEGKAQPARVCLDGDFTVEQLRAILLFAPGA